MELLLQLLPNFLLIFCRITALFVVVPIISSRNVPTTFKIGLGFFISVIVFSALGTLQPVAMDAMFILLVLKEILVGLLLGFVAYLFFVIVQVAGAIMDIQIGLGLANIIDPLTGASAPILGNLKFMVAVLLFLAFDGHHLLLQGIMDSYKWVPFDNAVFTRIYDGQISQFLVKTFTMTFMLAFQFAVPVSAALFLADLGLGLLTRVAPQFNIFVVGIPVKIIVGISIVALMFPEMLSIFQHIFVTMFDSMQKLIQIISGQNIESP